MHQLSVVIQFIFTAYTILLFVKVMGSWFPNFQQTSIMRFVNFYTEPYLKVFRKIIPQLGMIDLSPLIAFFALRIAEKFLLAVIR